MTPDLIFTCSGGHECDVAATPDGWVMAAVCFDDVDGRFVRNMDVDTEWERAKALLRPGATYEEWTAAFVALRPTLNLLESVSGTVSTLHSESAEQFSGIAVAGGRVPAFLWTSLEDGRWSVVLRQRGESRVFESGDDVLLAPSAVRDESGRLWCAWVSRGEQGDTINVTDEGRTTELSFPGRYPSLSAGRNRVAICFERFEDGESHIYLAALDGSALGEAVRVSEHDPLNFLPKAVVAPDGDILVTWTSTPAWGFDIRVDQVRSIRLKRVDPESGMVTDGHGTEGPDGLLPIPLRSINRSGAVGGGVNMTPSNPRLLPVGDQLVCTFRMFQPDAGRQPSTNWIVDGRFNRDLRLYHHREGWYLCMTRWDGQAWSEPERVTGTVGFSHHPYGLAAADGAILVAGHCFNADQMPPRDNRVEMVSVTLETAGPGDTGNGLSRMHDGVETWDPVPVLPTNPPTHAPALPIGPGGLRLVFGDLHDHTSHSSCSPVRDGNPLDNMRLQRDVLGYEVLCIADHQRISDADFRQRLDLMERESTPGRVALYAIEWNKQPWQHINFYTYDKEVMKQLRQILLRDLDIHLMFNEIVDRFPNMVMANRHFHSYAQIGGHGIVGDTHTHLYDPRIEWAMEALHSRGDMMATEDGMFGGPADFPFPLNFIEWKKAKLGFIGGTDHHMRVLGACSTGFWVRELTGEGVFEALRERRTYACASGEIGLWVNSGDVVMGQVGRSGTPVNIDVSVSAPLPVDRVSLWSNGGYIQHKTVGKEKAQLRFVDETPETGDRYYFVRVQTEQSIEYPKGPIIAYSSPLYLSVR